MNKLLEFFNIVPKLKTFKVVVEVGQDGKGRIITPFYPGKNPWNYGAGGKPGDKASFSITLTQEESPYTQGFAETEQN
jgi:hypothetical protein